MAKKVNVNVRVNTRIPKRLSQRVKNEIDAVLQDAEFLKKVTTIAARSSIVSILQGKTPGTGEDFEKPNLSKAWLRQKKKLAEFGQKTRGVEALQEAAKLVFSGQFLSSIRRSVKVVKGENGRMVGVFGPEGNRKRYKRIPTREEQLLIDAGEKVKRVKRPQPPTNEKIGEYAIEQGRDWRGVTKEAQAVMVRRARAFLRRALRKIKL